MAAMTQAQKNAKARAKYAAGKPERDRKNAELRAKNRVTLERRKQERAKHLASLPKRDRTKENKLRDCAELRAELETLKPMAELVAREGEIPNGYVARFEQYLGYVWKHRMDVPGRDNTYECEPNLFRRVAYLEYKLDGITEYEYRKNAESEIYGRPDPKWFVEYYAGLVAERFAERQAIAHEIPTAEEMCKKECEGLTEEALREREDYADCLGAVKHLEQHNMSEGDFNRLEHSNMQLSIEADGIKAEVYRRLYEDRIVFWREQASAGLIPPRGIPERFYDKVTYLPRDVQQAQWDQKLESLQRRYINKVLSGFWAAPEDDYEEHVGVPLTFTYIEPDRSWWAT